MCGSETHTLCGFCVAFVWFIRINIYYIYHIDNYTF
nr:MAG TPA: hypothetical protein [Caudoviricetes sp.]